MSATLAEAMADQLGRDDRDATLMWLRWSGVTPEGRRDMAARIMLGSVFAQAAVLGLVDCARCGDRGCEWCRPSDRLAFNGTVHAVPVWGSL